MTKDKYPILYKYGFKGFISEELIPNENDKLIEDTEKFMSDIQVRLDKVIQELGIEEDECN